jgi:glycosyltransferase involved in cell wall biosynthesis
MHKRTVTLAAPSAWAARRFESSPIVPDDVQVNVVHNAINSADYRPIPRLDARRWLDLPEDRFIITIISHDLSDVTKNPESQRAALRAIAHLRPMLLLVGNVFGNPAVVYDPIDLRVMGFVKEEALKNAIFASSDIFVNTSLSDTFSLTTLEALASGTPVVAYASGGIPEIVVDGECGALVRPDDADALASTMARLITEGVPDSWRANAHERAAVFSPNAHVNGYRALYEQALAAAR